VIAIAGIAGVVAVAFVLSSLGAGGEATATSTTSAAVTSSAPVSSVDALCLHLRDLQTPREDSLTRLATTLQSDAAAIQGEGKAKLAAAVDTMRHAVLAYRDALAAQGDTTQAGVKIANALDALPC
jgi:hypothetical protein